MSEQRKISKARRGAILVVLAAVIGGARGAAAEGDGKVLEGMHPVGQAWVDAHGDYAESGLDSCRPCHGADLRGSALSRTVAERTLDARDFGRKSFWQGFQVGCYACHAGPGSERRSTNRAPLVADASLTIEGTGGGSVALAVADADGDSLMLRIVAVPAHGVARLEGSDAVYVPEAGFAGDDEFRVAAWDGSVDSNLAVVFVSVVGAVGGGDGCAGDCNGDGQIVVSELVAAVRRALGVAAMAGCGAADVDGDGEVAVGELVLAVRGALQGCGAAAAPTRTPTATHPPVPSPTGTRPAVTTPSATRPAASPTATPPPAATPTGVAPSFAALQAEIFSPSCATAFCHDGQTRAGGLNLAPGVAYAQLVGVAASNAAARGAGLQRVAPGMPDASFLVVKMVGPAAGQGFVMPPAGPLPAAQLAPVRAWIAAGALP